MRVVFDTNILISALLFKGKLEILHHFIKQGICVPCFTLSTLDEFKDVISRDKFKENLDEYGYNPDDVVKSIQNKGLIYTEQEIEKVIHQDPKDDKFLACAVVSQACFIVSGDKHLLDLKSYNNILIVSPSEFLQKIRI
ncbi:MAG: putative toxin-antitoxin system toxin component, PIN family [Parcubacteria group bacterium CG11_big_fil_rev_8_21_14_0_20_41_14]|nr:MAG: putative toxin-antitoxin system toxin component, PIN family [Parcubacteria group bacterium CG22_combo_CG10-13_8_21_14_all_41_9]PIQ80065.1 MAG: putative toxin-antitoxin system toxin component, PIN family [Parcubacteria group bacterium CG11_big_fil_rev_8_21_14_0_20_41_14]PIR56983.1 MAG: putative toxin-antitoxin system toxin component, PIN family [Parcubacteria group bacterium CG10_big_fil_rev_8_21_14_0_10_41_35]